MEVSKIECRSLLLLFSIFFMDLMTSSNAVVPSYCLQPLNRSDCKVKPTPVFYYWKPGARCEFAIWRGCPTENMFPDMFQCVDYCIYKMFNKAADNDLGYEPSTAVDVSEQVGDYEEWKEELEAMKEEDADAINQILDHVIEESEELKEAIHKLKGVEPSDEEKTEEGTEADGEAATEAAEEAEAEADAEAPTEAAAEAAAEGTPAAADDENTTELPPETMLIDYDD